MPRREKLRRGTARFGYRRTPASIAERHSIVKCYTSIRMTPRAVRNARKVKNRTPPRRTLPAGRQASALKAKGAAPGWSRVARCAARLVCGAGCGSEKSNGEKR